MRFFAALLSLAGLTACTVAPIDGVQGSLDGFGARPAVAQFVAVVEIVEPIAERECRRRALGHNCDFLIVVDDRRGQPANAHQFLSDTGQPVLAFNYALLKSVRNADELAFVMGHEAAHHIEGHLEKQHQSALQGAAILGGLVTMRGGNNKEIAEAQELGAILGARRYSKDFELEADALGAIITLKAGFDPVKGAEFFTRLPDPGNQFLGTHPPNADRMATVRKAVAAL